MIKKLLFLFFSSFSLSLAAQSIKVQGTVRSTADNRIIETALVMFINLKDSTLAGFVRTSSAGNFGLQVNPGKYRVYCFHPQCLDYSDNILLDSGITNFRMDTLKLLDKSQSIQTILISKFTGGIRMNGDTTEYLADFFKTNPGATVEDLLKRLPGIQVNRNGEITAQGEKVKKILVDGEEFFPDDPTVATKYLCAEMIDKVQVYDQREDTTSRNEEDKVKTLNLTLKQDKKKGNFGKAEAASNFNEYSNAGIFSGYFNKKLKAAAYLKTSNFENASLGWDESRQFGGVASGGYQYDETYGYYYRNSSFSDNLDSRGIPFNTSAGFTFNNTWDSTKTKLNASYRYANEGVDGEIFNNSTYFLPDSVYLIKDSSVNQSRQTGHRGNAQVDFKTDSFNTFKISVTAASSEGKTQNILKSGTSSSRQLNYTNRTLENSYNKQQLITAVTWNKKFRQAGKYIKGNLNFQYLPNKSEQNQKSGNLIFAENGSVKDSIKIDQVKNSAQDQSSASLNISAGNKINKYYSWNSDISANYQNNHNKILTFNRENGSLSNPLDSLSGNYAFNQFRYNASAGITYTRRKWHYWIHSSVGLSKFRQENFMAVNLSERTLNKHFINFYTIAGLSYTW